MRDETKPNRPFARSLRREMTKADAWLWMKLRRPTDPSRKFRRQHPIGPFIADFANVKAKLVIEIDGATHSTDAERAYDARRTAYLVANGWRVLRFTNDDVLSHLDQTIDAIIQALVL